MIKRLDGKIYVWSRRQAAWFRPCLFPKIIFNKIKRLVRKVTPKDKSKHWTIYTGGAPYVAIPTNVYFELLNSARRDK